MNIPFTHKQVKELPKGFTPSCTQIGFDKEKNQPIFYPNRHQRANHKPSKNVRYQNVPYFTNPEGDKIGFNSGLKSLLKGIYLKLKFKTIKHRWTA